MRSEDVLSTLAARREALAESVEIFPTFLEESRLTLTRLAFLQQLNPGLEFLELSRATVSKVRESRAGGLVQRPPGR